MLGALLVEASGREHLDCMELLIQSMACKPKRNVRWDTPGSCVFSGGVLLPVRVIFGG